MEDLNSSTRAHKIALTNRRSCSINGVKDVLSFDVQEILLETEQGMHVNRLSLEKGEVDIEGKLDSFTYSDTAPGGGHKGESLVSRLFR